MCVGGPVTSGPAGTAVGDRTLVEQQGGAEAAPTGGTHLSDELSSTEELTAAVDHLLTLLELTHTHTHTVRAAGGGGGRGQGGTLV